MKTCGRRLALIPIVALLSCSAACAAEPRLWLSEERNPINETRAQIRAASQTIDAVVYKMNENRIRNALREALERGVVVRIVADATEARSSGSLVLDLARRGAEVRLWSEGKLHAKFTIFDGKHALAGSFNWTQAARRRNVELGMILTDTAEIERLQSFFDQLWAGSEPSRRNRKSKD